MGRLSSAGALDAARPALFGTSDQMSLRGRTNGIADPQPPLHTRRLDGGGTGDEIPSRHIGHLDRAGGRQCRPDERANLTALLMEIV